MPTPVFHFRWCFAVAIVTLIAAQAAFAQHAIVEGNISDSTGPIEGATVAVSNPNIGSRHPLATDKTDSTGDYSIEVPMQADATIDVVVEAASPNHAPARHDWTEELPCYFDCGPGGEFSLTEGETVSAKNIVLESGGNITGTITDTNSNPLPDATVRPIRSGVSIYSSHFFATADSSGDHDTPLALNPGEYFLLAYPPPGENYVVKAWNDINCQHGQGCPLTDTDPVTIAPGGQETGIDFELQPGATIGGELFPDDINRIIILFDGSGKLLNTIGLYDFMLPEENWSFDGLSGGSYYIQLGPFTGSSPYLRILHNDLLCPWGGCNRARGEAITIPPGSSLTLADIHLEQGGQLEGTIIDAATGNAPAGVPADARIGSYDIITASGDVVGGGSILEDNGNVILDTSAAVPPGDYYVRTYSEWRGDGIGFSPTGSNDSITGYADAAYPDVVCAGRDCDLGAASTVTFTAGGLATIQIEVSTGSSVSGTVVDDDGGAPVENVVVKLVTADNEVLATALTDENGDYTFGAFPAGTYYVRTSTAGRYGEGHFGVQNAYFDKVHGANGNCSEELCDPTTGTPVELNGADDETLADIAIESGPVISGQIIYALTGLPINYGRVEVYDDSGALVGEYRLASLRDARYQTTALAPGDYTLVPVVSPAFSDVTTSGGSTVSSTTLTRGTRSGETGLTVTVESENVEANLQMIDEGHDVIFHDAFTDQ